MKKVNINIIGGGPVGLFMGICLKTKKDSDNYNVSIIEKRDKYTRDNVIGLLVKDLKAIISDDIYKKIKEVSCFRKLGNKNCYLVELDIILTPLKILETVLYNECIRLGINMIIDDNWRNHINNIDILFLATGAYNVIAEELINTSYINKHDYYGMCVFFSVDKHIEYNSTKNNIKPKIKSNRFRIFPVRKGNKMYMGISISKEEFDLLNETTKNLKEKNIDVNINTIPDKLKKTIKNGLSYYNIKNVSDTNIFPVRFGMEYNSKIIENITYKNKKMLVCLIGNQAYKHHFFGGRGIIAGFNMCYYVNKLISANYKNGYEDIIKKKYINYVTKIRRAEWNEYPDLVVPFEEIDELIKKIPKKNLDKIAKRLNINYSRINKTELAYVLGCNYIENCIGNKYEKA